MLDLPSGFLHSVALGPKFVCAKFGVIRHVFGSVLLPLMSLQDDVFCAWSNYGQEVFNDLTDAGWSISTTLGGKGRLGSRETARLFFVAQLHHIAVKGQWLQQFVLPILATVIQTPVRVFVPCER